MSPLVAHVLAAVCVFAVGAGILVGAQSALASLIVGRLRSRHPTLPERRAYLLRAMPHLPVHLSEQQRLESIRQGRAKAGAWCFVPLLFLDEILSRWLGVMHFDRGALTIEWAGLITTAPFVFGAALAVARARLSGDVSGQPTTATPA